jgi:hydrocephalus-inducing protein
MLAGKRCEMIFEFIPQDLELQEMFWRFKIPHFNVDQLFLFVGTTTEPRIAFDRGCVNFNALLVGAKASHTISLVNNEHIPFNFVFDKSSLDFAGETPALLVHPLNGVIPPNGRCPIEIEFIPNEEKTYNFNINCLVKRKPTRLSLNVKGEGYMIHDSLSTLSLDQAVIPVSFGQPNQIDFGLARIHDEVSRTIFIQNTGKFNLDFNWGMARHPAISIDPQNGTVKKNDKMTCKVTFNPIKPTSLDGVQLSCTIAGSRTYHFILNGSAIPPSVQFSFLSHDFGPCFIGMDDALPISESVYLNVLNQDADAVIDLDCHFEKKPYFRVDCPPMTLGPRESVDIPIIFTPRAEISYTEVISFSLNSSSVVNVTVRGEGIYAKVDLFNSSMHNINFGNLQLGHTISKMVKIINRSKRKVPIQIQEDFGEKEHSLEALGVSIFPQNEIVLKPKESLDLQLKLSATHRTPQFQKDISLVAPGSKKKLLTLSGSCQGMDVQLETDLISFGTVCMGSHLTRKIQLQNRGDLIAKFQWNIHQFQPDFTISPAEGTISPNQHKILEITFKPSGINPDVRYNSLPCSIEGGGSVFLTLTGCCVQQTLATGADIRFESRVREEEVKSIVIENKTNQPWNLHPVVQGDHWFCQENLAVAAEGKATLILHYYPLSMTQDSSSAIENKYNRPLEHSGSLFVAIPDGSALLYNLFGKALAPDYSGALSYSTPAKKTLSVSIPVNNWLKQSQSFDVEIDKSQNSESAVVQGSKSLFIQSASVRNYNVKIYCYLEGTFAVTIRFVNSRTGEYLLYKMDITVTQAEEIEVINLDAPVRQSVKKIITIENPFLSEKKIQFLDKNNWWKCSHPNVRVREISSISNRPEGSYEIEYRPLIYSSNPMEANLSISFVEIGEYCYKLILTSKLGAPERMLYFKTSLGSSQIQSFEFTTFNEKATEVNCSIQHPTFFSVPAVWKLEGTSDWDGIVSSLQIKFEPEALGEIRDMLVISSDLIGEYKCSLIGSSEPPMPQGPFVFTSSKDIEFKNVFSSARDFEINVDNPRFVVKSKLLTIPPKGVKMINVKYDAKLGTSTNGNTAKLFVTCSASKELPPWIYYLEAS